MLPNTSLIKLITAIGDVALEINQLSPNSETRQSKFYFHAEDLKEITEFADATHYFNELAVLIRRNDDLEHIKYRLKYDILKLNHQYEVFGESGFSKPSLLDRIKQIGNPDIEHKCTVMAVKKITFDGYNPKCKKPVYSNGRINTKRLKNPKSDIQFYNFLYCGHDETNNRQYMVDNLILALKDIQEYYISDAKPNAPINNSFNPDLTNELTQIIELMSDVMLEIRHYEIGKDLLLPASIKVLNEISQLSQFIHNISKIKDHIQSKENLTDFAEHFIQDAQKYLELSKENAFAYAPAFIRFTQLKDINQSPNEINVFYNLPKWYKSQKLGRCDTLKKALLKTGLVGSYQSVYEADIKFNTNPHQNRVFWIEQAIQIMKSIKEKAQNN